jgi:hypothetical protein
MAPNGTKTTFSPFNVLGCDTPTNNIANLLYCRLQLQINIFLLIYFGLDAFYKLKLVRKGHESVTKSETLMTITDANNAFGTFGAMDMLSRRFLFFTDGGSLLGDMINITRHLFVVRMDLTQAIQVELLLIASATNVEIPPKDRFASVTLKVAV